MARNIQREFVKYYKERLASLGFIKVKGRQPYFVRVINDEISQICLISCRRVIQLLQILSTPL